MNRPIIVFIIGWILRLEGVFMAIPCITALCYQEVSGFSFLIVGVASCIVGLFLAWKKPKDTRFYMKEGLIATALGWIILSVVGCLPFVISGEIPSFTDALFETISGFTTTGSSILENVESLSHCMLMWRSFTHWIGGMGVLVFLLSVIQMAGGSHMNLMKAESPGPSVGKLGAKVGYTARALYIIYVGMTIIEGIFLLCGGMSFFDTCCITFGTAGTGGFGIKADSMASYSPYLQWVVTIFMMLFGVNFNFYFLLVVRKFRQAFGIGEVFIYLGIILASVGMIVWNIYDTAKSFGENLLDSAFQVSSIITTTGYSTVDFGVWPFFSQGILVTIMFIGACAGSTGGGIKVSRIELLIKNLFHEIRYYLFPKSVHKIRMDGKVVEKSTMRGVNAFFVTYMLIFAASVLVVSIEGYDLVTNFTAVAATFNNIGPGLGMVGPNGNFGFFSDLSKYVMMFDMIAGRLELFPLLTLLYPPTWRGILARPVKRKEIER